jgi:SsrA-binding protein
LHKNLQGGIIWSKRAANKKIRVLDRRNRNVIIIGHDKYVVKHALSLGRVIFIRSICNIKLTGGNIMVKEEKKVVAQNKKARHDYFIEQTIEAGIVLSGTEVKSIRAGKVSLMDSYANIKDGEVFIYGMHISPYEQGNIFNKDPLRDRKLLLNRFEINKLIGYIQQKGMTLVPLKVYFNKGRVKIELGIGKGKKLYDKREDIAKKDAQREIDRRLKDNTRY